MQLPLECIESILDHFEVWQLVPLLTVNSVFFHASAKRIYANPIRRFKRFDDRRHYNPRAQYQAAQRLLATVIRYSPAQDPDVQSLRLSLSTDLEALPENPTVDYISLIKTIPYDERSFGGISAGVLGRSLELFNKPRCIEKNLHDVLVWAACGHRLFDMLDIELLWHDLDRYRHCIENMTSMRSIHLHLPTMYGNEDDLRILNDILRFMEQWAEAYAKLGESRHHPVDIQLVGDQYPDWLRDAPCSQMLQRIFALMPTSTLTEISSLRDLEWARFNLATETIDLHCVRTFVSHFADEFSGRLKGASMATVLQRFRNLRRLELKSLRVIDYDLFQWACDERQRSATATITATSTLSTGADSLVPLSELQLAFSKNVPWHSAIYGFGATLTTVKVKASGGSRVDLCIFHDIPNLQRLYLSVGYIANNGSAVPFSGCPRLVSLTLSCGRADQVDWNNTKMRNVDGHGYLALGHRNVSRYSHEFNSWDIPRLKRLTLTGPICHRFHQETLRIMGRLEYLTFNGGDKTLSFMWDMCVWTCASFPHLKELRLYGYPAHTFAWSMLDQCPALEHLDLGSLTGNKRVKLDSKLWPSPLTPRPNILKLAITGFDISEQQQPHVFDLVQAMPNLTALKLNNCINSDSSLQRRLEAELPRLKYFHLYEYPPCLL